MEGAQSRPVCLGQDIDACSYGFDKTSAKHVHPVQLVISWRCYSGLLQCPGYGSVQTVQLPADCFRRVRLRQAHQDGFTLGGF